MKHWILSILILALASVAAEAAPKAKSQAKKKKTTTAQSKTGPKLPTKLPPKKKMTVDFESNSGTHTPTVVVRTPLPLSEALDDKATAEKYLEKSLKESKQNNLVIVPKPIAAAPTPTPAPTTTVSTTQRLTPVPSPSPVPKIAPVTPLVPVVSAPTPEPKVEAWPIADAEVPTPATPKATPAERALEGFRLLARTSYVSAKYSRISPELEDGQTTLALGLERAFENRLIGRGLIELGHGMDQSVTIQNTRTLAIRGDLLYLFDSSIAQPFAGGGLGFMDATVRSYRSTGEDAPILREHADTSSLFIAPFVGLRFGHERITIDLTAEYSAVLTDNAPAFGGWTGALTFGFAL